MHVHMLLMKDRQPVFSDDNGYAHLSETAHYFMGGLLKHIGSLCALTNPSSNSFKRLVPGFEAPVTVGYATSNRSAVIRIPAYAKSPDKRRFELRNPDATCNPYFCYAAILMAGLDGVKNKIDPHAEGWGPYDFNLFHLPEEEKAKLMAEGWNYEGIAFNSGFENEPVSVVENSTVPVIETGAGNCHFYVDESANIDMAIKVALNAKCSRPLLNS